MDDAAAHPEVYLTTGRVVTADSLGVAMRSATMDLASQLGVSEQEVLGIAADAKRLESRLPDFWAAFLQGRVDERNARTAAQTLATIPAPDPEDPEFDADSNVDTILDAKLTWHAADQQLTPSKFRARARTLRERLHPEPMQQRYRRAFEQRAFWVEQREDGMCEIGLLTDAVSGERISGRIDAMTKWFADQPDDSRTYPQLRSDIARDLLMEGAVQPLEASGDSPARPGTPHVQVQLSVSIPALTLLGKSDLPATLNGVGPIPLDLATELAGEATTFRRVLTDPVNGSILDAESATRRLSADLEWFVRHVHKTCRGPGCNRPAAACDIDHTIPWAHDGPTRFGNLGPLHRGHHTVKHDGGWTLKQVEPGVFKWTSPTGHEITIHPDDYCPF